MAACMCCLFVLRPYSYVLLICAPSLLVCAACLCSVQAAGVMAGARPIPLYAAVRLHEEGEGRAEGGVGGGGARRGGAEAAEEYEWVEFSPW